MTSVLNITYTVHHTTKMFLRRTERLNRKIKHEKKKGKETEGYRISYGWRRAATQLTKKIGGVRNIFKGRVGHKYNTFIYLINEICDTVTDTRSIDTR